MKKGFLFFMCGALLLGMSSCKKSENNGADDTVAVREQKLQLAMTPYIHHAVVPIYQGMADFGIKLADDVAAILAAVKSGNISEGEALMNAAAEDWIEMRKFWEQSEAWLYGPADFLGVDPHIDSWPFNATQFDEIVASDAKMAEYEAYMNNNEEPTGEDPYGTLGFHALEYVLFNNGEIRTIDDWSERQWTYMAVVAKDLRNQAILLEAGWAGLESISADKQEFIKNIKEPVEMRGAYGDYMLHPGEGRVFANFTDAAAQLVEGCIEIANEVGVLKIGNAATGEDPNYIESRYSNRSKYDFADNIRSIRYAYEGKEASDASIHTWLAEVNPTADKAITSQIITTIEAIDAIEEPFFDHATDPASITAMEECEKLRDLLQAAHKALTGYDYEIPEEEDN